MSFFTDTSPFWRYIRDRLGWGIIASPGALAALVHGLARYMDVVRADILWVRAQFVPPRAEDSTIPLHGYGRGAPRTRFDTDGRYRSRVERAFAWHYLGGKERGMEAILREYGYAGSQVHNRRLDDPDLWAHFNINLLSPPPDFSGVDVEAAFAIANQYKPARSVISTIRFAREQRAALCAAASMGALVVVDNQVAARQALPPEPAPVSVGAAAHAYITVHHYI